MKYNLGINDRAFDAIKEKRKKVELRVTTNEDIFDYNNIKENDIIFFENSIGLKIKCIVNKVNWYSTIEELLSIEGTKYTLSSTDDFNKGVESIKNISGYSNGIDKNGIYAIHIEIKESFYEK